MRPISLRRRFQFRWGLTICLHHRLFRNFDIKIIVYFYYFNYFGRDFFVIPIQLNQKKIEIKANYYEKKIKITKSPFGVFGANAL